MYINVLKRIKMYENVLKCKRHINVQKCIKTYKNGTKRTKNTVSKRI